jgi:hypothetical protein
MLTKCQFWLAHNPTKFLASSFATYGCLLLMIFYFFAAIGMEIFGGKITFDPNTPFCGNPALNVHN